MANNINWGSIYKKTNFGKGVTNATNGWGSIYANLVSSISGILSSLKSVGTYYENEEATEETLNSLEKCKILEKASILITPTSYSDGVLHAAKPTNGLGVEEVVNGDFETDSDWTKGTNITINEVSAIFSSTPSGNSLTQSNFLTIGKTYIFVFSVSNFSEGSVKIRFPFNSSNLIASNGTYTETAIATSDDLTFQAIGTTTLNIDNVSVKEVISADLDLVRGSAATRTNANGNVVSVDKLVEKIINGDFKNGDENWNRGAGWTVSDGMASCDGTDDTEIQQSFSSSNTILKKITFTVLNYTSGTLRVYSGAGADILFEVSENGTYTYYDYLLQNRIFIYSISSFIGSVDNVSVKEVIDVTNIPRIDYTGGVGHILLEGQATNLITYSEDFSDSSWNKQAGVTPTYNTTETLSPDGTNNATKIIGNGNSGIFRLGVNVTGDVARTVYLKSVTGSTTAILRDPYGNAVVVNNITITEDWQRFDLVGDNEGSIQGLWVDDITSSGLYMWGAQLETGTTPSTYIPTSGGTATRLAETLSRGGLSSLINSEEGVWYLDVASLSNGIRSQYISLSDNTSNNRINLQYRSDIDRIIFRMESNGSQVFEFNNTNIIQDNYNRIAIKWGLNNFAVFINGIKEFESLNGSTFSANVLNFLSLSFNNGSTAKFEGKIKTLAVYKEALTDAELQCLTTQS